MYYYFSSFLFLIFYLIKFISCEFNLLKNESLNILNNKQNKFNLKNLNILDEEKDEIWDILFELEYFDEILKNKNILINNSINLNSSTKINYLNNKNINLNISSLKNQNLISSSLLPFELRNNSSKLISIFKEEENLRLPDFLQPLEYKIKLILDSEINTIEGKIKIKLKCIKNTSLIKLNIAPDFVQIGQVFLESELPRINLIKINSINIERIYQQLFIYLNEELEINNFYYLNIWFTSKFSNDGRGLSRNYDKERGIWINSLFEPSFARRLFPCFDEPKFRSSFQLEVWLLNKFASTKEGYKVISATESKCINNKLNNNTIICYFEQIPSIPTYLFSLAIGRFQNICKFENFPKEMFLQNSNICIWKLLNKNKSKENSENERKISFYIIKEMAKFQKGMFNYIGVLPNARLHLLIIPMRLWPLFNDTIQNINRFEKTLFHEMAHQWFGNLVTMKWWNSIWLSESLSTFMSSQRPIVFNPLTDLTETKILDNEWAIQVAKGIVQPIPSTVYRKGPALLEMLDSLIGAKRMQKLLRRFIFNFKFCSADSADFIKLLREEIDENKNILQVNSSYFNYVNGSIAANFFESWLYLPSYPVVFIEINSLNKLIKLTQKPKIKYYKEEKELFKEQKWIIPIWIECLELTLPEQLFWLNNNKGI